MLTPSTADTNDVLTATATKSDPEGDPVSLTWEWRVNGVIRRTFTSGSALTDTFDLSLAGNGNVGDTVDVTVTPSDASHAGTPVNASVTITAANQAPEFTTDLTDLTLAEGASVSLDANATDPDGNALTYSATALPAGVTIDPGTGVISGLLGSTTAGIYDVTVTVSDGFLTDTDTFRLTVTNTNQAPVFTTDWRPDRRRGRRGQPRRRRDRRRHDTLTYSATGLPAGVTINCRHGRHQRHPGRRLRGHLQRDRDRDRRHRDADAATRSPGRSTPRIRRRPLRPASRRRPGERRGRAVLDGQHRARPRRLPRLPRDLDAGATTGTRSTARALLTSPSYTDTTAVNGTTYYYVVVAVDNAGQASAASSDGDRPRRRRTPARPCS